MQNNAPKLFIALSFVMAKYLTTQMRICRRLAAVCASHTIVHAALRKNGDDLCEVVESKFQDMQEKTSGKKVWVQAWEQG